MELLLKRIKLIDSRSKDDIIRLELYSILVAYILSTEVFKSNKDIKEFIDLLKLKKGLKEYVYGNRTQIIARICREIEKSERDMLLHNVKVLKNHALNLEGNNSDNNEKSKKNIVDMINKYSRNK